MKLDSEYLKLMNGDKKIEVTAHEFYLMKYKLERIKGIANSCMHNGYNNILLKEAGKDLVEILNEQ